MARKRHRRRRSNVPVRCRDCGDLRLEDELFFHGRCPACRVRAGIAARARTGARVLAKSKAAGTVERDGKAYQVLVLPPKRRRRRR